MSESQQGPEICDKGNLYVSQVLDFIKHLNILVFFLDVCFEERYKNSVNKFDKMASVFVIASIKLCPPSGLLEPPPGSRQKTPGPDDIITFISIPIWLLNKGESSHFKWKSFAKTYGMVTWTLPQCHVPQTLPERVWHASALLTR